MSFKVKGARVEASCQCGGGFACQDDDEMIASVTIHNLYTALDNIETIAMCQEEFGKATDALRRIRQIAETALDKAHGLE